MSDLRRTVEADTSRSVTKGFCCCCCCCCCTARLLAKTGPERASEIEPAAGKGRRKEEVGCSRWSVACAPSELNTGIVRLYRGLVRMERRLGGACCVDCSAGIRNDM